MDTAHGDATAGRCAAPGPYGRTSTDQAPGATAADQEAAFRSLHQGDPIPVALAAGMASSLRWQRVFQGVDSQLEQLRRWLESLLPASPARDDLVLVAIELGTNAVRHTASGRGGQFVVEIIWRSSAVRVIVADDGAATEPRLISDPLAESGRGLLVVQALAERSGACGDHRGRQVWADIPWPGTSALVIRAERPDATEIGEPEAGHGSAPDRSRGRIGPPTHGAAAWRGLPVCAAALLPGGRPSPPAAVASGALPPPALRCRAFLRDGPQIAILRQWLALLPPYSFRGHLTCVVVGPAALPGGLRPVRGQELPGRHRAGRAGLRLPGWAAVS